MEESDGDKDYASLPEFHRFEIPFGCHWNDVRETTSNVGLAIEKALRGIEQTNQQALYGILEMLNGAIKTSFPTGYLRI